VTGGVRPWRRGWLAVLRGSVGLWLCSEECCVVGVGATERLDWLMGIWGRSGWVTAVPEAVGIV
jgi:hypothetical protein